MNAVHISSLSWREKPSSAKFSFISILSVCLSHVEVEVFPLGSVRGYPWPEGRTFQTCSHSPRVKGTRRGVLEGFSRNALFWFQNKTLFLYTPHILSSPGKHRPLPFLTVNHVHLPLGERFTRFLFRRRSHRRLLTPVTRSPHPVPRSYAATWKPTQAFANGNLENFGHSGSHLWILCTYFAHI